MGEIRGPTFWQPLLTMYATPLKVIHMNALYQVNNISDHLRVSIEGKSPYKESYTVDGH